VTGEPRLLPQRLETDPESVERDLFKLVLTIVELVRQLMEKQALRRVDEGDLTDEQIEGLGTGLMHLEQAMEDLKGRYGLTTADLNIDLIEEFLGPDDVADYAGVLMDKIRNDQFPSLGLMNRVRQLF